MRCIFKPCYCISRMLLFGCVFTVFLSTALHQFWNYVVILCARVSTWVFQSCFWKKWELFCKSFKYSNLILYSSNNICSLLWTFECYPICCGCSFWASTMWQMNAISRYLEHNTIYTYNIISTHQSLQLIHNLQQFLTFSTPLVGYYIGIQNYGMPYFWRVG